MMRIVWYVLTLFMARAVHRLYKVGGVATETKALTRRRAQA